MKTKILIGLIILIGLVIGGFFVWKNISSPEEEKKEVEKEEASPVVEKREEGEVPEEKEEIITPSKEEEETPSTTFFEDFESGIQKWDLEEGWHLEKINNNTVLRGKGHRWAKLKDMGWSNYAFRAKFKMIQGTIHFNYRCSEPVSRRYIIGVNNNNFYLKKQVGDNFYTLIIVPLGLDNGWHGIDIKGYENTLNIYIDNVIYVLHQDENFILSGGIAFETLNDSEFLIDDIEVFLIKEEDVVEKIPAATVSNTTKSGVFVRDEIWSGEILITGDVTIIGDLTILPGTVIKFAVQDDQQTGYEAHADGYNDLDPTRMIGYAKTHSSLKVTGKMNAAGVPENRILFTSAAENPKIADWIGIHPVGDGSLIEYTIIEWSRTGISIGDEHTPNSIFRNNIIRYTLWGPISTGWSSCQVYSNEIYECGHEGVDVQGGEPIIENNTIEDCHAGIVVLRGSAVVKNNVMKNVGRDFHIGKDGTPILENNYVELAPENSDKEWCYENFCYPMIGEPAGTPIFTEVYKENNLERYAVPTYKIEHLNYTVELPMEVEEWLVYGWKNDKWQKIEVEITANKCELPSEYSMYVFIPNPTKEEKDSEKFNEEHSNIYRMMAV